MAAFSGFPLERQRLALATMGSQSHGAWLPKTDPDSIDNTVFAQGTLPTGGGLCYTTR